MLTNSHCIKCIRGFPRTPHSADTHTPLAHTMSDLHLILKSMYSLLPFLPQHKCQILRCLPTSSSSPAPHPRMRTGSEGGGGGECWGACAPVVALPCRADAQVGLGLMVPCLGGYGSVQPCGFTCFYPASVTRKRGRLGRAQRAHGAQGDPQDTLPLGLLLCESLHTRGANA